MGGCPVALRWRCHLLCSTEGNDGKAVFVRVQRLEVSLPRGLRVSLVFSIFVVLVRMESVMRFLAMPRLQRLFAYLAVGVLLLVLSCSGPQPGETGGTEERRVYHVQLQMTEEKEAANRTLGQALVWWEDRPPEKRPPLAHPEESPADIKWKAPYYRVRLGPFATREQAESILGDARSSFPDAFVAPEQVATQE